MKALRVISCSLGGFLLFAAPLLLVALAGVRLVQVAPMAILVGLIGMGIFGGAALYDVPVSESISRILRGFAWTMLERNLDAGHLVPFDDVAAKLATTELKRDRRVEPRARKGASFGFWLGAVASVLILPYLPGASEDSVLEEVGRYLIWTVIFGMLGALYMAAMGMLTVPGRHRLTIPAGALAGAVMGALIAAASTLGPVSRHGYWSTFTGTLVCLFSALGVAAGMLAPEAGKADNEADDKR